MNVRVNSWRRREEKKIHNGKIETERSGRGYGG